jgi:WD40 repeat protein
MKFSACGRLLATAGQDRVLRIWVLRDAFAYFQDMRTKYNAEKVSPTPSQESLVSQQSMEDPHTLASGFGEAEGSKGPFMPKPFCKYTGHTSDLLDVSWSKNYFVLSSSMDKTVSSSLLFAFILSFKMFSACVGFALPATSKGPSPWLSSYLPFNISYFLIQLVQRFSLFAFRFYTMTATNN